MCPICTIGVVAALGISRWLNIDDSILGLWVGAFLLSLSLWTFNWIFRKREKKPMIVLILILFGYILLTYVPMEWFGYIPALCKKILGIKRIYFGTGVGVVISSVALAIDRLIRNKNNGKVLFYYQKVILPISLLLIASLVLNAICA